MPISLLTQLQWYVNDCKWLIHPIIVSSACEVRCTQSVVTVASTGSAVGGGSGHHAWGWWLSTGSPCIEKRDWLPLSRVCLWALTLCQVVPVVQWAISHLLLQLGWSARLVKTSGRLSQPFFPSWMRFPKGEKLDHCFLNFFRFQNHSSSGASLHLMEAVVCLNADKTFWHIQFITAQIYDSILLLVIAWPGRVIPWKQRERLLQGGARISLPPD